MLQLAYGFAIPDNPYDAYALRMTLSLAPPGSSGSTAVTLGLNPDTYTHTHKRTHARTHAQTQTLTLHKASAATVCRWWVSSTNLRWGIGGAECRGGAPHGMERCGE